MFEELPKHHFKAILADPPWRFQHWSGKGTARAADNHFRTVANDEIAALPIKILAADDCVLFLWVVWPKLEEIIPMIRNWGFEYKTCAFLWTKAHAGQIEMFRDDFEVQIGLGYWTRANTELCLLSTRGNPRRVNADVWQAIVEPRREHSRKPDCVYERIERLVEGPYLELFARTRRPGWTAWGNEINKFKSVDYDANEDMRLSLEDCYAAVRERKATGGPGWPK